jgi:hypothetical protein
MKKNETCEMGGSNNISSGLLLDYRVGKLLWRKYVLSVLSVPLKLGSCISLCYLGT